MTEEPPPGMRWPETRAELARRFGVHHSAIYRALSGAAAAHAKDPTRPPPPQPVNPGQPQPRYLPSEFDPWWALRPGMGRPRKQETPPRPADDTAAETPHDTLDRGTD